MLDRALLVMLYLAPAVCLGALGVWMVTLVADVGLGLALAYGSLGATVCLIGLKFAQCALKAATGGLG